MTSNPPYFDYAATSPVLPEVAEIVLHHLTEEFGNAGSRTHALGTRAKKAVEDARAFVAQVVDANPIEVLFTSGATESNNLAILGLAQEGVASGRKHIVTTEIEHKAVLEPIEELRRRGFEVEVVGCNPTGRVAPESILELIRPDTLLVSVMHVNNETGIKQPIADIAEQLGNDVYLHVDGAQGFGKDLETLQNKRIDLISISGHKIYGPKGVGALVARRRGINPIPLTPLMFGGGQELGLRPGTLAVPLIAGLGIAAKLAISEYTERLNTVSRIENQVIEMIEKCGGVVNGDRRFGLPYIVSASITGLDSEAFMVAAKDTIALSNGAACASSTYTTSHVLEAMGLPEDRLRYTVRLSWSHLSGPPPTDELAKIVNNSRW
jgi:cysteine desulfurase